MIGSFWSYTWHIIGMYVQNWKRRQQRHSYLFFTPKKKTSNCHLHEPLRRNSKTGTSPYAGITLFWDWKYNYSCISYPSRNNLLWSTTLVTIYYVSNHMPLEWFLFHPSVKVSKCCRKYLITKFEDNFTSPPTAPSVATVRHLRTVVTFESSVFFWFIYWQCSLVSELTSLCSRFVFDFVLVIVLNHDIVCCYSILAISHTVLSHAVFAQGTQIMKK